MTGSLQYSAEIDMYLIVGGEKLNVAACHGSYCIVRSLKEMEPCLAELVIVVDGYEQREQVYLKNGLSLDSPEVEYESLAA